MPAVCDQPTLAQRQASANFALNLAALRVRGLRPPADTGLGANLELVFARDGTLTVIDPDGRFAGGCSVPTRAARAQLTGLSVTGSAACLLAPPTAAAVRVTLDLLRPDQALIVLIPEVRHVAVLLHCDDFSAAIERGRLWLAGGDDWSAQLRTILLAEPGLAIPTQFVRLKSVSPATTESLIAPAQQVFSAIAAERQAALDRLSSTVSPGRETGRLCVVGGSRFRLWADSGFALQAVLNGSAHLESTPFDTDNPLCATPLALASATRGADAIVTADLCRADVPPGVAAKAVPWVAWLTRPRAIPPFDPGAQRDGFIVVDPAMRQAAIAAGWPAANVVVGGWPTRTPGPAERSSLALIANIPSLEPPAQLDNFSSHRLLWEWIASQMQRDPMNAFDSADALIERGARELGLKLPEVPVQTYADGLIAPAYAIGMATILRQAGLPLKLFGEGWDAIGGLAGYHAGVVKTREQFDAAVGTSLAIVRHVPTAFHHPVDALRMPIVGQSRRGQDAASLVAAAKSAIQNQAGGSNPKGQPLTAHLIRSMLHRQ